MKDLSRRDAMGRIIIGGAGLALSGVIAEALTGAPAVSRAFSGSHQPKPLPFDPAKLKGISEKLIRVFEQ